MVFWRLDYYKKRGFEKVLQRANGHLSETGSDYCHNWVMKYLTKFKKWIWDEAVYPKELLASQFLLVLTLLGILGTFLVGLLLK